MEKCNCIKQIVISGNGKAMIYPDYRLFKNPLYSVSPLEGCFCPRSEQELSKCLQGCFKEVINESVHKFSDIKQAFIIDENGKEIPMKNE